MLFLPGIRQEATLQKTWPLVLVQPLTLLGTVDTFLNLSGLFPHL